MDLLKAIRKNDISKVEKILKKGYYVRINDAIPDAQEQVPIKTIPLCLATARGQLNIVKLLLHYGADVRAWNGDWASPIHLATYRGYIDILKYFLSETSERGYIINSVDQLGDTPLHIAARYSKVDIVHLLLEHNCDFSVVNKTKKTPLDVSKEIYGEEADLICTAIVTKMRQQAAKVAPPAGGVRIPGGSIPQRPTTAGAVPSSSTGAVPPPSTGARPATTNLDVRATTDVPKKLNEELVTKENKITNLEDDITTAYAEKNKIKVDIAKLTEKLNQQDITISRKEAEKTALEKECVLIRKRLNPERTESRPSQPNIQERNCECPVCLEVPLPPKNVYQCTNGHIYCSECKDMPNMNVCPQCRVPLDKQNPIRNIAFTEIVANLFPNLKQS